MRRWLDRWLDVLIGWMGVGEIIIGHVFVKLGRARVCMGGCTDVRMCVGGWVQVRVSMACRGPVKEQKWLMCLCHLNEPQTKPRSLNWSVEYLTSPSFFSSHSLFLIPPPFHLLVFTPACSSQSRRNVFFFCKSRICAVLKLGGTTENQPAMGAEKWGAWKCNRAKTSNVCLTWQMKTWTNQWLMISGIH